LVGKEYDNARETANRINRKIRDADPAAHMDRQVHEIHPVKFGGDPVDPANKIILSPQDHYFPQCLVVSDAEGT
jgi:toxin YxiD